MICHQRGFAILSTIALLLLCASAQAADECPSQSSYRRSCLRAPPIRSYDDFKNIVEAASSGDQVCFSDFRVSVNETAEPTIISKDVHIICKNFNCVFEGGNTFIRFNGRKAKAILQGFTFSNASQPVTIAKEKKKGQRQKICNVNFFLNNSTKRGSAIGVLENADAFVGNCRFRYNQNNNQGGAIYNVGHLTVYKSYFEHNSARIGGAIMNEATATIELNDCSFSNNSARIGGAVMNVDTATIKLNDCSFSNNSALVEGPAVYVQGGYNSVKGNAGNEATNNVDCNGIFYEGFGCTNFDGSPSNPIPSPTDTPMTPDGVVCEDYSNLKFYTIGTKKKRCKWLARDADLKVPQFCSSPREEGIVTLADALCPKTCNKCSFECVDSPSVSFKRDENGSEKNCEYLNDPEKGEKKRAKYCSNEPGMNTNADAVCPVTCNKCQYLSVERVGIDTSVPLEAGEATEMPSSVPSAPPTPSPTNLPTTTPTDFVTEWRTNPKPLAPAKGYFNYDPNDSRYGPNGWKVMRPDEVRQTLEYKYWKEFERQMNENYIDLDQNYCGDDIYKQRYIQSPIDISDAAVDGECREYHQVRDEPGNYRLDDEGVEMQILPSKLRIKWPRTFDDELCPNVGNETDINCPPSADIPKAWGHHLPVIHCDFKMPSEHTLDGKRYAAEYSIWHWQSRGKGAPVVNMLVDVPDVPGEKEDEYYNDYFQIAIDEWKKAFVSQEECKAKRNLTNHDDEPRQHKDPGTEEQTTPEPNEEETEDGRRHDKPPGLRGLSHPDETHGDTHFNPYHPSLMTSIWFYGYDKVGLTEPPCTPIASYHVVDTPMRISTGQLRELQQILFSHVDEALTDDDCTPTGVHFGGNVARPTQEFGSGRDLHRCTCTNFYSDKFRKKTGLRDCDDSF